MTDCPLDDGIWAQVLRQGGFTPGRARPALFLDRDGVVVEETGFLHRPQDVRLIAGAADIVAAANRLPVPVVLVTNQSGIGRGMYAWAEFAATQDRVLAALAEKGAAFDMVLACPFHPQGRAPFRHPDHPCRKPRPGMLLKAAERLNLDLAGSWMVGDRTADILAARNAGLAGALHVLTGHGAAARAEVEESILAAPGIDNFAVEFGASIEAARTLPIFPRP